MPSAIRSSRPSSTRCSRQRCRVSTRWSRCCWPAKAKPASCGGSTTARSARPSTSCRRRQWTLRARHARSTPASSGRRSPATDLPKVVELSLYRRTQPDQLSRASLQRLLALEDQLAIVRLASIDRAARDTLFELNDTDLKNLARSLTEDELSSLSRYLTGLQKEPRERVLRAVAANPAQIHSLSSDRVRQAVVASTDQSAAVSMMLRSGGGLDPGAIAQRRAPRRRRPRQPDPAVGKAPAGDRRVAFSSCSSCCCCCAGCCLRARGPRLPPEPAGNSPTIPSTSGHRSARPSCPCYKPTGASRIGVGSGERLARR